MCIFTLCNFCDLIQNHSICPVQQSGANENVKKNALKVCDKIGYKGFTVFSAEITTKMRFFMMMEIVGRFCYRWDCAGLPFPCSSLPPPTRQSHPSLSPPLEVIQTASRIEDSGRFGKLLPLSQFLAYPISVPFNILLSNKKLCKKEDFFQTFERVSNPLGSLNSPFVWRPLQIL